MIAAVLVPFALALVTPVVARVLGPRTGLAIGGAIAAVALWFASLVPAVSAGGVVEQVVPWSPSLGVELALRLDGLSLLFALLITGIGALVLLYAGGTHGAHPRGATLQAYLLFFMGSMLGLVLADDLLALFVFWELTSISSYLLIGFDRERAAARAAADQALIVTVAGGLAMLPGLILLGSVAGTGRISVILERGDLIRGDALYLAVLLLILAGAFTKSAQVPFHFWLPNAMEAPTAVSAYLHSATMVNAGVFLLARLSPALAGTAEWTALLVVVGLATAIVGAFLAFGAMHLKRMLAYSTVAALGLLTALLGVGTPLAVKAAVLLVLAHALYKGGLFLVAGGIDKGANTTDVRRLGGLRLTMPRVALAGGLAAMAMASLPPLLGFYAKESLLEAFIGTGGGIAALLAVSVVGGLFVAVGLGAGAGPFFGPATEDARRAHEPPWSVWAPPLILGVSGVILGLAPALAASLVSPAAGAIQPAAAQLDIKLWHGFTPALVIGVLTLAAGAALHLARVRARPLFARLDVGRRFGPERAYTTGVRAVLAVAATQTRVLQSGYLRVYVLVTVAAAVALVAGTGLPRDVLRPPTSLTEVRFYDLGLALIVLGGGLAAVLASTWLAALVAVGMVGYGIALLFVLYGAPDLGMTQFLVETLTVILLVLVTYHLPSFRSLSRVRTRALDALVAGAAGVLVAVLVLLTASLDHARGVSGAIAELSRPAAHGGNVVNVILVDFRALDTLGEVVVLAVAAVGVFALLRLRPGGGS